MAGTGGQLTGANPPLIALVGGAGFLGRYVAQELLRTGARVRVVSRNPGRATHLKPMAGLGQIAFIPANLNDPKGLARAVAGCTAVVNLVGLLKGDFYRAHITGPEALAKAATEAGATAFVHVSAIGADPDSPSAYGRSKGEGEARVRAAFPQATIIRPSILFGREDGFVNRFAGLLKVAPIVPVIRGPARFQPAFVADAAEAIAKAALDPVRHGGHVYELGGPEAITMRELIAWIGGAIGYTRPLLDVPDLLARPLANWFGWLPGAPITGDQFAMLTRDNVVAPGAAGFGAFGIEPRPLAAVAETWLVSYRKHGRFAQRTATAA